ncbi:uncharacterized protein LOC123557406 [Mercenaria mercenaria]|uniref:uncharacterized protein LOC123557406 n=1 Tax=Mercenaria mercenaria TaxID=6596 RepID=UPI00234EFF6D|nr:uncharacterized protein LOC123557406 [Mercenaria mercenaria]
MSLFIFSNFWSLTKLIYCLAISFILSETKVTSQKTQYLFVDVLVDSKSCSANDSRWNTQQNIVFEILDNHPELGLTGSGKYCGCRFSKETVCNSIGGKAVESLLYDSKDGSIHANVTLEAENPSGSVVPHDKQPYYVCAKGTIITADDARYKTCNNLHLANFNNTMTKNMASSAEPSGPGAAIIAGAAVGALAVLGLLSALGWLAYRHIKNNRQVDDSASSSDINPIIPGTAGFGEAPNSVPPAGTS